MRRIPITIFFLLALTFTLFAMFASATIALAQSPNDTFVPLLPDLPIADAGGSLDQFLNGIFALTIGIAAILAVIMIVVGGFRYMMTESPFQMGDAKGQIADALIGLLIVLASVLILRTINPELVQLNVFRNAEQGAATETREPSDAQTTSPDTTYTRQLTCPPRGTCVCPSYQGRPGHEVGRQGNAISCAYSTRQQTAAPAPVPPGPGGQDELPPPNETLDPNGSQQGPGGQDELPPPAAPPPPQQAGSVTNPPGGELPPPEEPESLGCTITLGIFC